MHGHMRESAAAFWNKSRQLCAVLLCEQLHMDELEVSHNKNGAGSSYAVHAQHAMQVKQVSVIRLTCCAWVGLNPDSLLAPWGW
jgi:hypothetical protein